MLAQWNLQISSSKIIIKFIIAKTIFITVCLKQKANKDTNWVILWKKIHLLIFSFPKMKAASHNISHYNDHELTLVFVGLGNTEKIIRFESLYSFNALTLTFLVQQTLNNIYDEHKKSIKRNKLRNYKLTKWRIKISHLYKRWLKSIQTACFLKKIDLQLVLYVHYMIKEFVEPCW